MNCQYCGNDVGNRVICPYCGHKVFQDVHMHNDYYDNFMGNTTIPVRMQEGGSQREMRKYLRNIDTWGLMSVILLTGIFIVEILRLIIELI